MATLGFQPGVIADFFTRLPSARTPFSSKFSSGKTSFNNLT